MTIITGRQPNYDRFPVIAVPGGEGACVQGWDAIADRLSRAVQECVRSKVILVVECYTGVDESQIPANSNPDCEPALVVQANRALRPPAEIDRLVEPFLGGDDPVFGFLSGLTLPQFFDPDKIAALAAKPSIDVAEGLVLVVGCGARLIAEGDMLVYADLARWEAQNRFRRNEAEQSGRRESHARRRPAIQAGVLRRLAGLRPLETPADRAAGISCSTPTIRASRSWPKARPCGAACGTPSPGPSASCRSSIRPPGAGSG